MDGLTVGHDENSSEEERKSKSEIVNVVFLNILKSQLVLFYEQAGVGGSSCWKYYILFYIW